MGSNDVLTAISTVGFPIVACGALYYLINKTLAEMKKTIDNNTLILTKLLERLNKDG